MEWSERVSEWRRVKADFSISFTHLDPDFIFIFLPTLLGKIAPALSDWKKIVVEEQFSSLDTVPSSTFWPF